MRVSEVLTSNIFIGIALFALVKPDSLTFIGFGALEYFLIAFDVVLMLLLVLNIGHYRVSKQSILIAVMYFFLALSTWINRGSFDYLVKTIGPAVAACLYTDYCMQRAPVKFIHANVITWEILLSLNLLTIILFPGGMYANMRGIENCYLMGYAKGMMDVLLPYMGFTFLYAQITKGKYLSRHSLIATVVTAATVILTWSATGIILTVLMLVGVFASATPLVQKLLRPKLIVGAFYLGTILIVFMGVGELFEPLIVGVLKKDLTFTGRTVLWQSAIESIKQHWLIGIGQGGFTVAGAVRSYLHPHCLILDMLYKGGIFMFACFVWVLHRFANHMTKLIHLPVAKAIMMTVGCFLFGEMVNSAQYKPFFWAFIVMAIYIPQLSGVDAPKGQEFVRFKV